MSRYVVLCAVLAATVASASAATTRQTPNALQGTWRLVGYTAGGVTNTSPQPGLYILTPRHYSIMQIMGTSPRPLIPPGRGNLTADQMWEIFGGNAFQAQSGTYDITPDAITVHPLVAKAPSVMTPDYWMTYKYVLQGTALTITAVESNSGPLVGGASYTLERVVE